VLALLKHLFLRPAEPGRRTTYQDRYLIASLLSVLPLSLPFILRLFGSDKQKPGEHSYGASYAAAFRPFRYRNAKILEIGLLAGDSLLAWRCYFPRATVIGADIEQKPHMAGSKTRIYTVDQSAAADLDRVLSRERTFDIIIDDGSHINAHQIFTFYHLFDALKEGGVYVIEDIQTSFWSGSVRGFDWDGKSINDPAFSETFYGEALELAKYVNHAEFGSLQGVDPRRLAVGRRITRIAFEHNLVFIWKGDNAQPSNYMIRPMVEGDAVQAEMPPLN
jgi:hypothetical protein